MKISVHVLRTFIILVSDRCLVYMISLRVLKRIFILFYQWGDCKCRKRTQTTLCKVEFIDSRNLPSVGRFLALLDLEAIHLPERCLLVLLFSSSSLFSVTLSIWRQRCRLSYMTLNKYLPKRETCLLSALVSVLEKLLGPSGVLCPLCTQGAG